MNEKPLIPWVWCTMTGEIISAHCTCMAGLGETCSHVGALLWAIESGVKKRDEMTVTDKSAYWVLPPAVKKIPYAPVTDIKISQSKSSAVAATTSSSVQSGPIDDFLMKLSQCSDKSAVLAIIPNFCDDYIPKSLSRNMPATMKALECKEMFQSSYDDIKVYSQTLLPIVALKIEEQMEVESVTRNQSKSPLWHRYRAGRITASNMKSAISTSITTPSRSVISSICYPGTKPFETEATRWGKKNEDKACKEYVSFISKSHNNFFHKSCGLFIYPNLPYIAATPDAVVCCDCCGEGVVEIKVAYARYDTNFI